MEEEVKTAFKVGKFYRQKAGDKRWIKIETINMPGPFPLGGRLLELYRTTVWRSYDLTGQYFTEPDGEWDLDINTECDDPKNFKEATPPTTNKTLEEIQRDFFLAKKSKDAYEAGYNIACKNYEEALRAYEIMFWDKEYKEEEIEWRNGL